MSRSALLLRLKAKLFYPLSVKNKGNRWLLKLQLRYWYTLTSKCFEICRQLLSSLTLCLCETGVNTTFRVLNLDWLLTNIDAKLQYDFCGRYGYSFWPIWSFRVADVVVTDMVCGRYGTDPYLFTEFELSMAFQYSAGWHKPEDILEEGIFTYVSYRRA